MSPALGTNGGRSKSTTVFMHFWKIAKIRHNRKNLSNFCARDFGVTKICNVYVYDLRNKEIKTGVTVHIRKWGPFQK